MTLTKLVNYLSFATSLILLIVLFSFSSQIYHGPKVRPNHAHITLYLDRNFDDFEQESIIGAAHRWTEETNHIIEYDVVQLPTKEKIDTKNGVIIVKISPDSPEIIIMDNIKKSTTLGYYEEKYGIPTISLVSDRLTDEIYLQVVMHELGHSLGLEHIEGLANMDALMFPYVTVDFDGIKIPAGSDHLTEKDLDEFCKLYHCDPKKLEH